MTLFEKVTGVLFPLGRTVTSAKINEAMSSNPLFAVHVYGCFNRHVACNWGDLSAEDKKSNDEAVNNQGRIFSSYEHKTFPKVWIITEWDRSATTVLFPEDY